MSLINQTLDVKIECYEGPLSVLVGLIKKNKVSIWDIPLSLITERFLEYVDFVQEINLRIAEDFIDMASLLIYIKSKMLLPAHETDNEYDPREELVERIIAYEKIRSMAEIINALPMLYRDTFCREQKTIDGNTDFDLLHLCNIFFELIKNREEKFIIIREIKPTLEEKLAMLKTILDSTGLFEWNIREQAEYAEKIATVLGMLELTKIKVATISQRKPFGKIVLKRREFTTHSS
jgi:segregation and condensation protein A